MLVHRTLLSELEGLAYEVANTLGPEQARLVLDSARAIRHEAIMNEELLLRVSTVEKRIHEARIEGIKKVLEIVKSYAAFSDPVIGATDDRLLDIIHDLEMTVEMEIERYG